VQDKGEKTQLRKTSRKYKKLNGMLTPMSKYYASEMSVRVSNDSMAVLGGSGYMKDYPVERHVRDARITTIYEGTSQLQIIAAVRGVVSGSAAAVIDEILDRDWPDDIKGLVEQVRQGVELLAEAIAFTKEQGGMEYMDLYGRRLVDMAIAVVVGALFCDHATAKQSKIAVARRWLAAKLPEMRMNRELICSGDRSIISQFAVLAGPVPVVE
jgi:hypothetical protein